MPTPEYHLERYHKHRTWMRIHGLIALVSSVTIVGLLWAWAFLIRGWQHRQRATEHQFEAEAAEH